jgi:polyhydroxybutyrate depolymerase
MARVCATVGLAGILACAQEPTTLVTPPEEGQAFTRTVESGGRTRSYQIFVPPTVTSDVPAPVMIALHTSPGTGSDMRGIGGFDQIARLLETIMVYPDATNEWAEGCDCTQADQDGVDDVLFIHDLLNDLDSAWRVNRSRVYAVGYGQGGLFAQRLACELGDEITAIAVVATTMSGPVAEACDPGGPMPFLMIHGTLDPIFPASGGGPRQLLSARAAADFWVTHNQCGPSPTNEVVLDAVVDGTVVNVEQYQDCTGGAEVEFYEVVDGGHTWPNPILAFPPASGLKTREVDGAATIGVFFLRHG